MKQRVWMGGLVIAVLVSLPWGRTAWAVRPGTLPPTQYPFETTVATTDTSSVGSFSAGSALFGFRLIADDAGDSCGLYDVATLGSASRTQGIFIDELVEDTDNRTIDSDWPAPYVLATDLTIVTDGLICIVYHNPQ